MKKPLFILTILCSFSIFAQHTFSIVAVDPVTGEIGSAGATCISAEDGALAISDIILGVGAIHTQSFYNTTNQNNARARMEAGDSPQEIMDWLVANDVNNNPSQRQYGAVDLNEGSPRSAAFTGVDCFEEFIHITGPNYAIQGNILISEDVVVDMETAFLAEDGTLADKLMAALQGAKRPGADSRCLNFGVSSASAFIRVADPSDTDSSYGNLSLDLNVWITNEVFEPIDELQTLYDDFLTVPQNSTRGFTMYPNPAKDKVTLKSYDTQIDGFVITDINGKIITETNITLPQNNIVISTQNYKSGLYFVTILKNDIKIATEKLLVN